jgi:hypothetical protein
MEAKIPLKKEETYSNCVGLRKIYFKKGVDLKYRLMLLRNH